MKLVGMNPSYVVCISLRHRDGSRRADTDAHDWHEATTGQTPTTTQHRTPTPPSRTTHAQIARTRALRDGVTPYTHARGHAHAPRERETDHPPTHHAYLPRYTIMTTH